MCGGGGGGGWGERGDLLPFRNRPFWTYHNTLFGPSKILHKGTKKSFLW